jgi:hypothetical protein
MLTRQLTANVDLAHTYTALGEYGRAIASLRTAVCLEGALRPSAQLVVTTLTPMPG